MAEAHREEYRQAQQALAIATAGTHGGEFLTGLADTFTRLSKRPEEYALETARLVDDAWYEIRATWRARKG